MRRPGKTWIRSWVSPSPPIAMNCSGKHAGMIRTAQSARPMIWRPIATRTTRYSWPSSRRSTTSRTSRPRNLAVDGCGAPSYALSLYALARAYGRLGRGRPRFMRLTGCLPRSGSTRSSSPGPRRDENALIWVVPGLIAKAGAEATYAVGLPDGRGVAVKISDGSPRARAVAMAGVLQRLGFDHETLDRAGQRPRTRPRRAGRRDPGRTRRPSATWAADGSLVLSPRFLDVRRSSRYVHRACPEETDGHEGCRVATLPRRTPRGACRAASGGSPGLRTLKLRADVQPDSGSTSASWLAASRRRPAGVDGSTLRLTTASAIGPSS